MKLLTLILSLMLLATPMAAQQKQHPCLMFNTQELETMKNGMNDVPAFKASIDDIISKADDALGKDISIPQPCDGGGGPVHEQHKQNYYELMDLGVAYSFTGNRKYADRAIMMLEAYARLYPTLDFHPLTLSPVPGRLFWQTLNESVWLVHTSVAYDCVREAMTKKQRENVEKNLLTPMATFIMQGMKGNEANLKTFNKMHNHGTWATAAVGMAGMAMDNTELVEKALYGTDRTGRNGGFLQQMDWLFSPDGYFTEGAYYQRYSLWPFVMFAQCIEHNRPELRVFEKRNHILEKALDVLVQLSYAGEFMHINDAMEKGLSAQEIVYAVDILYAQNHNSIYTDIARNYHHQFIPCIGGYELAREIESSNSSKGANGSKDLSGSKEMFRTTLLHDGRMGDEGGIGIIRRVDDTNNTAITLKATSHGLSHGHYDKLTMAYYDNGSEILMDYGASRFINIDAKHHGHYTKENNSLCKQTIAHNALVVDERSCYNGKISVSSEHHPSIRDIRTKDGMTIVSAVDSTAFEGVRNERTLCLANIPGLEYPVLIDILNISADKVHRYDLPFWYRGQEVSTNFSYQRALDQMHTLGRKNGYQHIWVDADGVSTGDSVRQFTFYKRDRMYTITSKATAPTTTVLMHMGANDPNFNLRSETGYLLRIPEAKDCIIASVIEPHGQYDVVWETAAGIVTNINDIDIKQCEGNVIEIDITYHGNRHYKFQINN